MMQYKSCLSSCFIILDAVIDESDALKFTTVYLDQDDFLPRTATPLEDIFKSLFWYVLRTCVIMPFGYQYLESGFRFNLTVRNQLASEVYTRFYFIIWSSM